MEDIKVDKIVLMNIIFPLRGEENCWEVLLGIKTRKIGVGLFNGYGGKVEFGETISQSASNELFKESWLKARPEDFEHVAIVDFYIHKDDGTIVLNKCDIFLIKQFTGEARHTVEMENPTWFPTSKLPLSRMMPDVLFWIPLILKGDRKYFVFHYNETRTKLIGPIRSESLEQN